MSLGADFLADYAFEIDYPFGVASDTWQTRDGRKIPVKQMTEKHIRNCMKLVGEDDDWYGRFERELKERGLLNVSET